MRTYQIENLNMIFEELHDAIKRDRTVRIKVATEEDIVALVQPFVGYLDHEEAWVVCTDSSGNVNSIVKLYTGTLDRSPIRISEVFREAIITNSYAAIFIHNHPNGDTDASDADSGTFRAISRAGELLEIATRFIIISGDKHKSY